MDAKEIVLDELEALGTQDVDRVCSTYTDDCYLLDVALGESTNGQVELRKSLEALYISIPDLTSKPHRIVAEGNLVALEYELAGHHRGEMFGMATTDNLVRWRGFALFDVDVDAQRIRSESYYYDVESLRKQMSRSHDIAADRA